MPDGTRAIIFELTAIKALELSMCPECSGSLIGVAHETRGINGFGPGFQFPLDFVRYRAEPRWWRCHRHFGGGIAHMTPAGKALQEAYFAMLRALKAARRATDAATRYTALEEQIKVSHARVELSKDVIRYLDLLKT